MSAALRILVADDNPINLRVATRVLKDMGHSGVLVNDGEKALRALEQQAFDLVLMDVTMPGMDGLTAVGQIRAREAAQGSRRIPIVMVTAHDLPSDREHFLNSGADGHVAKPLEADRLMAELRRIMPGRLRD